jgi:hypothetical protein
MALQLGALRDRLASIETKLAVLMVMVGGVGVGVASLVWKAFVVLGVAG